MQDFSDNGIRPPQEPETEERLLDQPAARGLARGAEDG